MVIDAIKYAFPAQGKGVGAPVSQNATADVAIICRTALWFSTQEEENMKRAPRPGANMGAEFFIIVSVVRYSAKRIQTIANSAPKVAANTYWNRTELESSSACIYR